MTSIIVALIMPCLLASSIRLAVTADIDYNAPPQATHWRIVLSPYWCFFLVALLPAWIGGFGRGENSALPWDAFRQEALRHGFASGLLGAAGALTAILWMLWIPAHLYVSRRHGADRENLVFARALNVVVGLLLMTPGNPVYRILDSIPR
jgi:hypothetical protein